MEPILPTAHEETGLVLDTTHDLHGDHISLRVMFSLCFLPLSLMRRVPTSRGYSLTFLTLMMNSFRPAAMKRLLHLVKKKLLCIKGWYAIARIFRWHCQPSKHKSII